MLITNSNFVVCSIGNSAGFDVVFPETLVGADQFVLFPGLDRDDLDSELRGAVPELLQRAQAAGIIGRVQHTYARELVRRPAATAR